MLTVDFERLGLRGGERVLDLGAGGGRHAFEVMRRGGCVTALDYCSADLKDVMATCGAMLDAGEVAWTTYAGVCNGDALDLPFGDGAFDRVITSEVLEHIWDDDRALAEMVRVLRPGGRLAVTVPTRWPERVNWALNWRYNDTPGGHVRIYRQRDLEAKLERAGLYLRGSHHAHAFHSPYWWLKNVYAAAAARRRSRAEGPLDHAASGAACDASPVRHYHDFLVWCIEHPDSWIARAERWLDPVVGKSLVLYGEKVQPAMARHARSGRGASA